MFTECIKVGRHHQAVIPKRTHYNNIEDKSILLWDCTRVPECEVEEYVQYAREHWPTEQKFSELTALCLLTAMDYSVLNTQIILTERRFLNYFIKEFNSRELA